MFFAKQQFIVFLVVLTLTNFIVTIDAGCTNRQSTQNGVIGKVESERNIPNFSIAEPYEEQHPYQPEVYLTKNLSERKHVDPTQNQANVGNITLSVDTRNNFGDLPRKCGPNEERIHGECREV